MQVHKRANSSANGPVLHASIYFHFETERIEIFLSLIREANSISPVNWEWSKMILQIKPQMRLGYTCNDVKRGLFYKGCHDCSGRLDGSVTHFHHRSNVRNDHCDLDVSKWRSEADCGKIWHTDFIIIVTMWTIDT